MIKRVNTLTAMIAIFLTAGLAHADIDVAQPTAQGRSCSEARQAAWFLDELARTDGNVEPGTPYVACDTDRRHYAEFGLDAD